MSAEELKRLQETDRTLEIIRRAVLKQQSENGVSFVEKEGLIYRVARAPLSRDGGELYNREQLMLPVQCRGMVMELAHSIPLESTRLRTACSSDSSGPHCARMWLTIAGDARHVRKHRGSNLVTRH